jgi:hypothetical protein
MRGLSLAEQVAHDVLERPTPHPPRGEKRLHLLGRTKADERMKGGERHDLLGLGAGVPIGSLGGVEGQLSTALFEKATSRLLPVGVSLDGQGTVDGEDLQQVGELVPEALEEGKAEGGAGMGRDQLVQSAGDAVDGHRGGGGGMGTEPQLGLGLGGRTGSSLELGQGVARSPCVRADRRVQWEEGKVHQVSEQRPYHSA